MKEYITPIKVFKDDKGTMHVQFIKDELIELLNTYSKKPTKNKWWQFWIKQTKI
jgi:hypothetical protein